MENTEKEKARIAALESYNIMDTLPEEELNDIVKLPQKFVIPQLR